VDDYIRDYRDRASREMGLYIRQRTLADAVEVAARCVLPSGKRHKHQRRIPHASLDEAQARLLVAHLGSCRSFGELHTKVNTLIREIHMIGALVVYDVSHRIGAFLRLEPERVYLHRGTREGALSLGLGRGRESIYLAELPEEFRRLSAAEAEDCLCIYKERLGAPRCPGSGFDDRTSLSLHVVPRSLPIPLGLEFLADQGLDHELRHVRGHAEEGSDVVDPQSLRLPDQLNGLFAESDELVLHVVVPLDRDLLTQ
jgi:hypothetical protein